jgi:hypothetical protein
MRLLGLKTFHGLPRPDLAPAPSRNLATTCSLLLPIRNDGDCGDGDGDVDLQGAGIRNALFDLEDAAKGESPPLLLEAGGIPIFLRPVPVRAKGADVGRNTKVDRG